MNFKSLKMTALAAVFGVIAVAMAQQDYPTQDPTPAKGVTGQDPATITPPPPMSDPTLMPPTTVNQDQMTTTSVTTVQGMGNGMITGFDPRIDTLPLFERNAFQGLLYKLTPEQGTLVVKALFAIEDRSAEDKQALSVQATEDILMNAAGTDQSAFESMWSGLGFDERQTILTLARDAIEGGFADSPAVDKAIEGNTTSFSETTTEVDATTGTGVRTITEGMAVAPAATFAGMAATERLAIDGALTQIPRSTHVNVVNALSKITNDGSAGNSMGWDEAKDTFMKSWDSGSDFNAFWNGLTWDQQHIIVQLTRDAYFGGLGDS